MEWTQCLFFIVIFTFMRFDFYPSTPTGQSIGFVLCFHRWPALYLCKHNIFFFSIWFVDKLHNVWWLLSGDAKSQTLILLLVCVHFLALCKVGSFVCPSCLFFFLHHRLHFDFIEIAWFVILSAYWTSIYAISIFQINWFINNHIYNEKCT